MFWDAAVVSLFYLLFFSCAVVPFLLVIFVVLVDVVDVGICRYKFTKRVVYVNVVVISQLGSVMHD